MSRLRVACLIGAAGLVLGGAGAASAQSAVSASPDVTVVLDGTVVGDEQVAADDGMGATSKVSVGSLPAASDLTGYHELAGGDRLFAVETTVQLAGLTVSPRDVVRWDGAAYTIELDGSAAGVPAGARVDAVSQTASGDLLLSFDTTVVLLGVLVAADEDLVAWDGASFSLAFDGSAEGISGALDLDGAHAEASGVLALSFDAMGSVGGVSFADEDVLTFDPSQPTGSEWLLAYDASAQAPDWVAADADAIALPEPSATLGLSAGVAGLAALRRRRSARTLQRAIDTEKTW